MRKQILNTALALTMAMGATLGTGQQAQAGNGVGLGIAAGIIGLGVIGAAAAAHDGPYYGPRYYSRYDDRCFYGHRECHWTNRHCFENDYGDTVCRGGRYICERPLICD